jgi:hypothetical protein
MTVGDWSARRVARVSIEASTDIDNLKLVLQPVFDLNGRVSIEGLPGNQQNLETVKVELVHEPYITQVNPRGAQAHADGTFELIGVLPGDYRVRVTSKDSYVMLARFGGADILNSVVHIDGANGNELEIRLKPNVSELDATVYDNKNTPLEGVQVVLVPDYPNRRRLEVYETGVTDASGHLHLNNVEPGNYKAFAWEYLESGRWQDADFIQRYDDLGIPVHIAESATGKITLSPIQARRGDCFSVKKKGTQEAQEAQELQNLCASCASCVPDLFNMTELCRFEIACAPMSRPYTGPHGPFFRVCGFADRRRNRRISILAAGAIGNRGWQQSADDGRDHGCPQ